MSREKFDPKKTYGTQPARPLKVGDWVKNEALYPATRWIVHAFTVGEPQENTEELDMTKGRIDVECVKGRRQFSAPYKWVHDDGTAIELIAPETAPEAKPEIKCPQVGTVDPRCDFRNEECPVHGRA